MLNCTYNYIYKKNELKNVILNFNQYMGMFLVSVMLVFSAYGLITSFKNKKGFILIFCYLTLSILSIILLVTLILSIVENFKAYRNSLGINQTIRFQDETLWYSCGKEEYSIPVKYISKIKKIKYFYVFELDSGFVDKSLINPKIPHRGARLPDLILLAKGLNVNLEL
ncbi:MAG: hypothetical protein FWC47_01160 [Oscillospiraceae bacterium]|nr:hypothetical protein [Oscillospiraceae bacterium]